jgi:hypothetical protein
MTSDFVHFISLNLLKSGWTFFLKKRRKRLKGNKPNQVNLRTLDCLRFLDVLARVILELFKRRVGVVWEASSSTRIIFFGTLTTEVSRTTLFDDGKAEFRGILNGWFGVANPISGLSTFTSAPKNICKNKKNNNKKCR